MLTIDGAMGEGGGQVLRTALALSAVTGKPFRIEGIRVKRSRPGLLRQHLTAVRAIAEVCGARVAGAELGSTRLAFEPGAPRHGDYQFAVGTAGSATLVLQTVLWPLLVTDGRSRLRFEGGTHNPMAPSFDFLADTFLPLLHRMGASLRAELLRPGFYPAGGGSFVVELVGGTPLGALELLERGSIERVQARAVVAQIPTHVAERELKVLGGQLADLPFEGEAVEVDSAGPGNVVSVRVRAAHLTETFTGFGERSLRAEQVAQGVAGQVRRYLATNAPVGEHLADQLLLPLALGAGGQFRSVEPSLHTRTNAEVIGLFLPGRVRFEDDGTRVRVGGLG